MDSPPRVAYFCMEFGLSHELTLYSGGLGVLAGDFMKSAGDLRLPVTGIGLMWNEGYSAQQIDQSGYPEDHFVETRRDALLPVDVDVKVGVRGLQVRCRAYRVTRYTNAHIYLLEPKDARDKWITGRLYGGGHEDRIAQEILLGVGGVRLLRALGREVDIYHFNEGHAVFAGLELVREGRAAGLSFDEALARVRNKIAFTTHTPVPAGNEAHELGLLEHMGATLGMARHELETLGGSPFGMTVAGLRMARRANAVSQLHAETARGMWQGVDGAAPIVGITNGVHVPSWQDPRVRAATAIDKPPKVRETQLFRVHQTLKAELIEAIDRRTGAELDPDRLLIGFARRAATYKRADLILGELARLEPMLVNRRVQIVFSGKAHPADTPGRDTIATLVAAARRWPHSVAFLQNYDMELGALLTRGCDVWLNTPRRPLEACGTSGMKAAMNGVLNLSILDGWWPEICRHGENGWQIGDADEGHGLSLEDRDRRDRDALYRVLFDEVIPCYYDDRARWSSMMEAAVRSSSWHLSSDRMLEDYFRRLYGAVDGGPEAT